MGNTLPQSPESFAEITKVSRETLSQLTAYADLLVQWNKRINLVAPASIEHLWSRHMLDSAQIAPHIPESARSLLDIGSGAGFPGLVIAALCPQLGVGLCESDGRKCAFLREAARVMGLSDRVEVIQRRIETLKDFSPRQITVPPDIVTARALSSLTELLAYAEPISGPETELLFLKGKRADEELTAANYIWHIDSDKIRSLTDKEGCLIRIKGFRHVRNDSGEDT